MYYLDDINISLYKNASFCSYSSIWHNWECVLIPHRLENWPLKLSQQCLCSTDRFPGEDWGSKPSGPLDSVGFIRKSSSTTAKSELYIRETASIETFHLLVYLAPVCCFLWKCTALMKTGEHSGSVTSPTQHLQIAGIGSPKAPLPSATPTPASSQCTR